MRPQPALRSGALQVPVGPSGREPRGTRAQSESEIGRWGSRVWWRGWGKVTRRRRYPSPEIDPAGVAFPGEARTWQQPREPGRRGPAPYPWLHQKGGECTEEFVHGGLLVT